MNSDSGIKPDTIHRMADIERQIATHSDWNIPTDEPPFAVDELTSLADAVKAHADQFFWNATTERFIGWQDIEGVRYDYGFVFVNNEAVAYGFGTPQQARQIYDSLDGKRVVDGDTSQGTDIYHWRFAPRTMTRRNTQDYVWTLDMVRTSDYSLGGSNPGRWSRSGIFVLRPHRAPANQWCR